MIHVGCAFMLVEFGLSGEKDTVELEMFVWTPADAPKSRTGAQKIIVGSVAFR